MKILYFKTNNQKYSFTEEIESSLKKLGHKVDVVDDMNFDIKELMAKAYVSDMFLFHRGGVYTDTTLNYEMSLSRLQQILAGIKCKKVCWFFDKGWFLNDRTLEEIIPLTDYFFMNDGNWVRRHKYKNVFELHSGSPKQLKGKVRDEYKCEIAYYGEVHNFIKPFINLLKDKFGRGFKVFNNVYGQDLADLVASSKCVFTPVQPNEEFYWCNRIYEILAYGGIAVYPKLQGLEEDGFICGKHYVGYKRPHELEKIIIGVLKGELDTRDEGQKFIKKFSWENRVKTLLDYVKN